MKTITEVVKESKSLVKEIDELVKVAQNTKLVGDNILNKWFDRKEYYGEMVEDDDKVIITQEVGIGVKPSVDYVNDEIVIKFGREIRRYKVGCLDRGSIKAYVTNGVLTVEGRRCDYDREAEEDSGSGEEE